MSRAFLVLPVSLFLLVACSKPAPPPEAPAPAPASGGVGAAPQSAPAAPAPAGGEAVAPAPVSTAPVAAPAGPVLASQETNWPGIVADVVAFDRKGNTLTAKVRLRNGGAAETEPEIKWEEVYLMDAANAKKYEALKDEKGTFIASLKTGWGDRWNARLQPGESQTVWVKFPAPPPEVKAITLQLPSTPPFEDLTITDR